MSTPERSDRDVAILAVDDVPENLVALDALLAQPGWRLLKAASADAALDLLLREDVALALIDVQMPGTDGFELAEIVRGSERTRRIPIIFLTAALSNPTRTFRGYEAGAVDFLHKPLNAEILKSKVGVFVDLYLHKRELSEQLRAVEEALKVNEMFAAVLGHDLRNPLAAVANSAYALIHMNRDPATTAIAERIWSSSRRMGRMITQLLDVARIRAGRLELDLTRADLAALCASICDEIDTGNTSRRSRLLASGDTHCDVDRMSQVLSNLISNAFSHGDPAQPIVVSVDGTVAESVRVSVTNGGHVPADKLANIFEPHHTIGEASGGSSGLSLGLHIVERFVAAHQGQVLARSDAALDTTVFEFTVPRRAAPGAS